MLYVIDLFRFMTESIMYQSFSVFSMLSIFAGSNNSILSVIPGSILRPEKETFIFELYHTFGPKRFGYVIDFSERFEIRYPSRLTSINKRLHIKFLKKFDTQDFEKKSPISNFCSPISNFLFTNINIFSTNIKKTNSGFRTSYAKRTLNLFKISKETPHQKHQYHFFRAARV